MKTLFSRDEILKIAFFSFLIWIPFGTRKFIEVLALSGVSELNSFFLYGSDILLFIFLIFFFLRRSPRGNWFKEEAPNIILLSLFLGGAAASIFFAASKPLAFYGLGRLLLGMILALVLGFLLAKKDFLKSRAIFLVLALSALFQSLIALGQFKFQRSLGLYFLGESLAGPFVKGVSQIYVAGGRLLRAYGTMPHANILAAFLVLGLVSFCFLHLTARTWRGGIFSAIGIFFVGLGLIFTFSRSGWLTALLATLVFLAWSAWRLREKHRVLELAVILAVCLFLLITIMGWAIFPRARLVVDSSLSDRLIYNRMALGIIKSHPLGVGLGNELVFGVENGLFYKFGLSTPNRWQPVHNLYLLMGSEIGILALVIFFLFVSRLLASALRNSRHNPEIVTAGTLLLGLLVGALADHFLWDLQSGRLMLWLIIGIMLGQRRLILDGAG